MGHRIVKLFAVVALVGCEHADTQKPKPAVENKLAPTPAPGMSAARPRVLPTGRPACGNVASRAPQPVDCK